jgi:DNA-binding IclR family transcriptional regulator
VLSRLVDQLGQNAHLAVLHGSDVYYVIEERAPGRAPLVSDVGVRLPATLTASGLAMLSRLTVAQLRAVYPSAAALVQRDGRGPGTLLALRSRLMEVRRRGFALEEDLVTPGLSSVGLPVLDHTGHPLAGISVTYQADRVDDDEQHRLVEAVRRAADALTRRLGG